MVFGLGNKGSKPYRGKYIKYVIEEHVKICLTKASQTNCRQV